MSKKIVVTGGTGFIGRTLIHDLSRAKYQLIVLTRNPKTKNLPLTKNVEYKYWNAKDSYDWIDNYEDIFAIINLAGENIGALRWTPNKKKKIIESRANAGNAAVEAIKRLKNKPEVIIQPSGIGFYGDRGEEALDESASIGVGFLPQVAQKWEESVKEAESLGVRLVIMRIGVVLGKGGGFLSRILLPFYLFMGGHLGNGQQWISWIHLKDLTSAMQHFLTNKSCRSVFNVTSPSPVISKDFYQTVGTVLKRPSWFHLPAFIVRLMFKEMADELILSGQKVIPKRLLESGFRFHFEKLDLALRDILC